VRRARAFGLAAMSVLPVALAAACAAPHDKVTAQHMTLIRQSLRTDGFRQFFDDPAPGTTVGCADRVLGADHDGLRVYLYIACGAWRPPRCGDTDGANGSFPVVATVSGNVVTWQQPGDGGDYGATIHKLFPRSLWSAALSPNDEPRLFATAQTKAGCVPSS
jgi:hypothetical protein